jgi:hypothetical protein
VQVRYQDRGRARGCVALVYAAVSKLMLLSLEHTSAGFGTVSHAFCVLSMIADDTKTFC